MVLVTSVLLNFVTTFSLCLLNWNAFYTVVIDIILIMPSTESNAWKEHIFPSIAAGLWALLIFRRHKAVYDQANQDWLWYHYLGSSLLYICKHVLVISLLPILTNKFSTRFIAPYVIYALVMSYTFYSKDESLRKARWEWFIYIVCGYNFAFSAWALFNHDAFPSTEMQIMAFTLPPLAMLVYMDIFP
jgi:hypothetical protein